MLWIPARKTRSGTVFTEFYHSPLFSVDPAVSAAVHLESDAQDDHENQDDDHKPPEDLDELPSTSTNLHDPLADLDDLPPPKRLKKLDFTQPPPPKGRHSAAHRRRQRQRNAEVAAKGHKPRPGAYKRHVPGAQSIPTALNPTTDLPAANGGYVATSEGAQELYGSKKRRTVEEFLLRGFQLIKWNGRDARPLVDQAGRIFAVLAGQPPGQHYAGVAQRAYAALMREGTAARFPASMQKHRHGLYAAINVRISYGQGQTEAAWLKSDYADTAEALLADPDLQTMASFASAMFAFWAPRLYGYYLGYNHKLNARRPFPKSVFSAAAFNFGPNVWTFKHRDVLNLPFGWCAIQALGNFDPTKGGHLILWDLRLVIEFPPGALILIPSATLSHSNIPAEFEAEDPQGFAKTMEEKDTRWRMGVDLWSTMDELASLAE
ncbi:hypothetical protein C8F01DRAFT_1221296 [Mycena amicta]|nr:hypothetical protein C8F01DRAFT_1221296 [Mycena amicta]